MELFQGIQEDPTAPGYHSTGLTWYVLLLRELDSYSVNLIRLWLLAAYKLSFRFFRLSLKLPACAVIFTNHIN